MFADTGKHSRRAVRSPGLSLLARGINVAFLALLITISATACFQTVTRVPVPAEDLRRANEITNEADISFARKDYYAALIKYLEASRLNPNSEYIYNKLGITYSRLRFYPQAIDAFNRAIGLNPKYPYSFNNLGSVYFASGDKKRAEKYFKRAIALKNDEASFHINLGTLLRERNKQEKGLEELKIGLSLDPDILKKSEGMGLAAASTQKNNREKSYYDARLFASMGNVDRAVESLQQALNLGFTNLEAIRTEKDFDPIRQDEKFIAFMKYAAQLLKM